MNVSELIQSVLKRAPITEGAVDRIYALPGPEFEGMALRVAKGVGPDSHLENMTFIPAQAPANPAFGHPVAVAADGKVSIVHWAEGVTLSTFKKEQENAHEVLAGIPQEAYTELMKKVRSATESGTLPQIGDPKKILINLNAAKPEDMFNLIESGHDHPGQRREMIYMIGCILPMKDETDFKHTPVILEKLVKGAEEAGMSATPGSKSNPEGETAFLIHYLKVHVEEDQAIRAANRLGAIPEVHKSIGKTTPSAVLRGLSCHAREPVASLGLLLNKITARQTSL